MLFSIKATLDNHTKMAAVDAENGGLTTIYNKFRFSVTFVMLLMTLQWKKKVSKCTKLSTRTFPTWLILS